VALPVRVQLPLPVRLNRLPGIVNTGVLVLAVIIPIDLASNAGAPLEAGRGAGKVGGDHTARRR